MSSTSLLRPLLGVACLSIAVLALPRPGLAAEGRPCEAEPTDEVIQYGDLITCAIDSVGESDTFRFAGQPNETVFIQVTRAGGGVDPCLELYAPDGVRIAMSCNGSASNRLDVRLTKAGFHSILVNDFFNDEAGPYNLVLERTSPVPRFGVPIKYGETLTGGTIDPVGDVDAFVFSGTKGQRIVVTVTRTAGGVDPCLDLYAPDGSRLSSACNGSASNRIELTLTQDGTHTVLVGDFFTDETGTYSVTLQCVVGACADASPTSLAAAVLPSSRFVQVGQPATAFATVINTGAAADMIQAADGGPDALGCGIVQLTGVPAQFAFQATDPATNQPFGPPNTAVNIGPGQNQSFVISLTPTAAFCSTDVVFGYTCANGTTSSIVGLNTLQVTASATPVSDIIALAATVTNDGIVSLPGPTGAGAFAVATSNVGAGGTVVASAGPSNGTLPLGVALCQTNPATGQCLAPPAPTVTTTINANATPTFAVFVTGSGTVPFDPAGNWIFVRFNEDVVCGATSTTVTRGSTSVAVRTQ